jgi:hypothetical protein
LKYFENYRLKQCIDTQWADISLVHASNILFRTAYNDDSDNYKFVLVSNSCIPLKSFSHIYNQLTQDNKSYFNLFPKEQIDVQSIGGVTKQNELLKRIPREKIGKSHQWTILNRTIVEKVAFINKKEIDELFYGVLAPDEFYYLTMTKLTKADTEDSIKYFHNDPLATTFTFWRGMNYKYEHDIDGTLFTFHEIDEDELNYLLESYPLFGRKFTENTLVKLNSGNTCSLHEYMQKSPVMNK